MVSAQTTQNPMAAHEMVILIDKSGSIVNLPRGIQTLKDAAKEFLQNMLKVGGKEKRVAIVAYDWEDVGVEVYKDLTTLTDSNLPDLLAAIDTIPPPGGYTGTAKAIDVVCGITQSEPGLGFMLHLTDGLANRPGGQEEGKRTAADAYDYFKTNCSLVGIVGINLDLEAEEHLRKMASPGLFSSVHVDSDDADPEYNIAQAMTQVAFGVGETEVKIAVLNWDSEPDYFTGELKNSVEATLQIASSRGLEAQPITPSEIAAGRLYSYDTLVLPDNAPPADVIGNIVAWWIGGKHIIAIDSGITFILYAGMLFPELADKYASFSEGTYWSYESSNATTVQKGHPVTAGHTPGEQLDAVASDALIRIDKLPSGTEVLAVDAAKGYWATAVFYRGAGSITFVGPSDDLSTLMSIIGNAMALDVSVLDRKARVGLLVPDLSWPYPDEMVRAFAEEVDDLGAELVFGAAWPDGCSDYREATAGILDDSIDVLVLLPETSEDAQYAVTAAENRGVPVIALNYLEVLPGADLYVAPDYFQVGVWQGKMAQEYGQDGSYLVIRGQGAQHEQVVNGQKSVLPDLIEFFPDSPSWLPEAVAEELESKFGEAKQFSAILASDEGYTSSARKWLANTNSDDGEVFLAGSDAWIYNARFLTVDQAAMDVLVDWHELGRVAARAAAQLAAGEEPGADRSLSVEGSQIPYLATEVIPIQKDTVYQILVEEQQLYHEAELSNIARGEIGPEGGELSLGDGTRLEIPSGALDRSYTITLVELSPLDRPWGDRTGLAPDLGEGIEPMSVRSVELLPSGLELREPAILSFHISEGGEDIFPFDEDPGFGLAIYDWQAQSYYPETRAEGSEIDLAERTVAFPIQHFSTCDVYDDFGPFDFYAHWVIDTYWAQEKDVDGNQQAVGQSIRYPPITRIKSEGFQWTKSSGKRVSITLGAAIKKLAELGSELSFDTNEQKAWTKGFEKSRKFGGEWVQNPDTGKKWKPGTNQFLKAYTCVFWYARTIKVYEDAWPAGDEYVIHEYDFTKGPVTGKYNWQLFEYVDDNPKLIKDGKTRGCP